MMKRRRKEKEKRGITIKKRVKMKLSAKNKQKNQNKRKGGLKRRDLRAERIIKDRNKCITERKKPRRKELHEEV